MLFAATDDFGYRLFFLLHILSVVVAFAPAVVHPLMAGALGKRGDGSLQVFMKEAAPFNQRIYGAGLIAAGFFGFGMLGMSDDSYEFSQTWVMFSIVVWIAMNGVLHGLVIPNERRWGDGDQSAERKVVLGSQILTVLLVVMLYLMIWKPGLS